MWKTVIESDYIKKNIAIKIEEIAAILLNSKLVAGQNVGYLTGQSGIILFINYYSRFKKIDNCDFNEEVLLNLINSPDKIQGNSLCTGWSGVLTTLNLLNLDGFIEIDKSIFRDTLKMTNKHLIAYSKNKNFDYLHGSFGVFLYLLDHSELLDESLINEFLMLFITANECTDNMLFRKTQINAADSDLGYCLGLAHGVPSIILILVRYLKKNDNPLAKDILLKSLNYLISTKFELSETKKSIFPSTIVNGKSFESQLSWCYGDLGCAYALYETGKYLNRQELISEAIQIMHHASKRRLPQEIIRDADFCHGTVGIAHIFSRFYNLTGIEEFKLTSEYWYQKTIEKAAFHDGLAGFKHYSGGNYLNKYCLLEGIAGIGLSFISAISDIEPKWDKPLLLS